MQAIRRDILPGLMIALQLLCSALGAWRQEWFWHFLPTLALAALLLIQYPKYLLFLLAASIPWAVEFNFTPSLGTDLPDEPLMLLLMFSMMIMLVQQRTRLNWMGLHPLLWIIILQTTWSLIAAVLSHEPLLSFKYLLAKTWYLAAFVVAPLMLVKSKKDLRNLALALLVSMMTFMLLALVRHAEFGFTFEKINKALQPHFRNHVNYSALLVFMMPLLLAVYKFTEARKWKRLLGLLIGITCFALYLSFARGAWLALITGLAAYWLLKRRWLLKAYFLFLLLTGLSVFYLQHHDNYLKFAHDYRTTIFHKDFSEHLIATYQMKDVSTAERFYRWIAGARMAAEGNLTGFGPSSFYEHYKGYGVPAFKTWVSRNDEHSTIHNYFLLLLVEQGIPGLLLFLILLALFFKYAEDLYRKFEPGFWKTAVATTASMMVMICTVNFLSDLVEADKVGSVYYLCIAALVIAARFSPVRAHETHPAIHSPAD